MSDKHPDLQCREVVELVTDYLEHALSIEDRNQLEQHLLICGACEAFVDQHTTMIHALSTLAAPAVGTEAPPAPPPEARAEALAAFRRLRDKGEP
jgi:anti-sigma factor RsiW